MKGKAKWLAIPLALSMLAGLCGCGSAEETERSSENFDSSVTSAEDISLNSSDDDYDMIADIISELEQGTNPDYFQYTIVDTTGSISITGYNGPDSKVIIPLTLENRPVKTISSGAFEDNQVIQEVILSNAVTTIEEDAFKNSTLQKITLSTNLVEIGTEAFSSCQLTEVDIPEGTVTIGEKAFYSCPLTRVSFPETLEVIGENAFYKIPTLTSVTIPSSVIEIGNLGESDLDNFEDGGELRRSQGGTGGGLPSLSYSFATRSFPAFDDEITIYGKSGSFAEKYVNATAEYYGYKFIAI